jgi:acetyltransferase-like isoleucine patch superfamily enzyme
MGAAKSKLKRALLYRTYLLTMRGEAMVWLRLRRWIFDQLLGRRHDRLNIFPDVFIEGVEGLEIGDNVSINRGCNISAGGRLIIGNDVSIGHSTSIMTAEHRHSDSTLPIKEQWVDDLPVTLAENIWIGARVCILAGVSLAPGTIVGAGSVVKQSVTTANCTIAGVPAKVIRSRS